MAKAWTRNAEAVVWVTIATGLFSLVFASGKFAGDVASPLQILLLRYAGGFIALICVVALRGGAMRQYASARPFSHFMRAVFGAYGGAAIVYASANMPIMDATAIALLQVIFVIALGVVVLGERIRGRHWLGIALCCSGAMTIVLSRGALRQFDTAYLWPAAIAVLGAFLVALEGIMIKTLTQSETPMAVLLHVNAFGTLLLTVPAVATWQSTSPLDNLPFVLLGPLAVTAQYFVIRGYRIADVVVVGPVDYTWLVFAALIGLLFFGEVPTPGVLAGSAVVATGGIVLACLRSDDTRLERAPREGA